MPGSVSESMRRSDLEHVIRASGEIAKDDEIIIIGSQAILGQFPDAPLQLLMSMEADVYPRNKPELADKVDGAIGEGSLFHRQNGYYAQGVGPETAMLPNGWQNRLVGLNNENTNGVTGLCLDVHDLAISKIFAGRSKDFEFIQVLIRHEMIRRETISERLAQTKLTESDKSRIRSKFAHFFSAQ